MRIETFGWPAGKQWPLALWLALLSLTGSRLEAQKIVPVHQEPRHRLLVDAGPVKVLDVQILPGDTTFFHTHDSAIQYVAIGLSTTNNQTLGQSWGNARPPAPGEAPRGRVGNLTGNVDYAREPYTHRVTNIGSTLFRLIATANYGSGRTPQKSAQERPVPGTVENDSEWFRTWRLTLPPRESTDWYLSVHPSVLIQVTPGALEIGHREETYRVLRAPGEVAHQVGGSEFRIRNVSAGPVEFVVVEARQ